MTPTPSPPSRPARRLALWAVGAVVAAALLVVGGTWVYINVLRDDAPDRLDFTDAEPAEDAESAEGADDPAGDEPDAGATTTTVPVELTDASGTWTPGPGSVAGYRVAEILFGQSVEAVGRTEDVSGTVEIDDTVLTAVEIVVDLASVTSDDGRRDGQFRGRIMDVATFPTAELRLTAPVELGAVPGPDEVLEVTAPAELTLRGATRAVDVVIRARVVDGTIEVLADVPVVFSDFAIPEPSLPGIDVEDDGLIEVRLVLVR